MGSHLADVWFRASDLQVVSGSGCVITTTDGTEYLDFTAGIAVASTGHCHPDVVAAIQRQAARFIHAQVNCYRHDLLEPLAERLASVTPDPIDTFFITNSGAEATEAAVKLARQLTGRPGIVVFSGSFHGRTAQTMAMTTSKSAYRVGHQPLPAGVFVASFPYPLRWGCDEAGGHRARPGRLRPSPAHPDGTVGARCGRDRTGARRGWLPPGSRRLPPGSRGPLPCPGHAVRRRRGADGIRPHRHDVRLRASGDPARRPGAGQRHRVGFPSCRHRSVGRRSWPDGRRAPTAGRTAGTRWVARPRWPRSTCSPRPGFSSRPGRGASSSAPGCASSPKRHPVIAEVRGPGLMVGVEFLRDGRPDAVRAAAVVRHCREVGRLLLMTAGSDANVVRWMPPLIVSESEVASGLTAFDAALAATASSAATT